MRLFLLLSLQIEKLSLSLYNLRLQAVQCVCFQTGVWGVEQALLVRRLVHYLCPSSNRFSHTDLLQAGPLHTRDQALAALYLITYLLQLQQVTKQILLLILSRHLNLCIIVRLGCFKLRNSSDLMTINFTISVTLNDSMINQHTY